MGAKADAKGVERGDPCFDKPIDLAPQEFDQTIEPIAPSAAQQPIGPEVTEMIWRKDLRRFYVGIA